MLKNMEEMEKEASVVLQRLIKKHDGKKALIIGLCGDLGAGKTAFVKACASRLGVTEIVTSPTFVIEKIYKLSQKPYLFLIHIDAYRLNSCEEMEHIGWNAIQKDPQNIVFIEWADRVDACMPETTEWITFGHVNESTRTIRHHGNQRKG